MNFEDSHGDDCVFTMDASNRRLHSSQSLDCEREKKISDSSINGAVIYELEGTQCDEADGTTVFSVGVDRRTRIAGKRDAASLIAK